MAERRDVDMANVSENLSDLGDKSGGNPGGNIQGGSGGVQGRGDRNNPKEPDSSPGQKKREE
jgi:hypothetical protein